MVKPKILIVDDRPENLLSMELLFENEPCDIVKSSSGNEALVHVINHDFAVVLLDVQMPGMDGFETAELMRSNTKTEQIPIIFVTAISKEKQYIFKGYEAGAVDYIFKPLEPEILRNKVGVFLRLYNQQKTLKTTNYKLLQSIEELEKSSQKILGQQKSVIEEERLKVILEMAGATAHELNQPLMVLLGSIELIEMCQNNKEKVTRHLARIKESATRISKVTQEIQDIQHYDVKSHDINTQIINFEKKINILYIEESEDDFNRIKDILSSKKNISLLYAGTIQEGLSLIGKKSKSSIDIIFMDYIQKNETGFNLMKQLDKDNPDIPVVIIAGQDDKVIASQLIQAGAYDYLPKSRINADSLSRIINHTLLKSRLKIDLKRMQARLIEISTQG